MKLHRTNLNLYEDDVRFLERHHGYGWTEIVREAVHRHVQELRRIYEQEQEVLDERGTE